LYTLEGIANMIRPLLSSAVLALTMVGAGHAATIGNGGFEAPGTFSGGFTTLGAGSSDLIGWTIEEGSIDLINTYWNASECDYSVDMSGNGPATISTTITDLVIGNRYMVSFDMAANPDGAPITKLLDVAVDMFAGQFSVNSAGNPVTWVLKTFEFVASSTTASLSFSSAPNGSGPFGPALDNVRVALVPVPAAGLMLLAGLGGLAALRRRKIAA
jgi:choice-of-anchor C domain-containing protein